MTITRRDILVREAAPQLLAALRAFVTALEATTYDVFIGSPTDLERLKDAQRGAQAAIAKAEGR